jgi:hypothetical protein
MNLVNGARFEQLVERNGPQAHGKYGKMFSKVEDNQTWTF